jgi:hypothetical protein
MEHKRYGAGTIVRSIIVILVSSTISIRFANQFVPCVNGLSDRQWRGNRRDGVSIVQRSGLPWNIMIHVRWGTYAPAQNTGDKESKASGKALDSRWQNEHSNVRRTINPLYSAQVGSVRHSMFDVQRSTFVVRRSPFTVHRSPFAVRRSPFTVRRSPFAVHRSAVHRSAVHRCSGAVSTPVTLMGQDIGITVAVLVHVWPA